MAELQNLSPFDAQRKRAEENEGLTYEAITVQLEGMGNPAKRVGG